MSNAKGHSLENMIELGCAWYRQKGIAEIGKTPEPFRVLKLLGSNKFTAVFIGKAQPDFQGTLNNGKSIVFEAKYTSNKERRINKSVITKAQETYLQSHFEKNAVVGVCVGIHNTYSFIPWNVWMNMKSIYGRLYMTEKETKDFEVKTLGGINFLDYVASVPPKINKSKGTEMMARAMQSSEDTTEKLELFMERYVAGQGVRDEKKPSKS